MPRSVQETGVGPRSGERLVAGFATANRTTVLSRSAALLLSSAALIGCSAISINDIKPLIEKAQGQCDAPKRILQASDGFHFVLPHAAASGRLTRGEYTVSAPAEARTFADFEAQAQSTRLLLPEALNEDPVTDAIFRLMIKTSAQAQVEAAKAAGVTIPAEVEAQVAAYALPKRLRHSELTAFAKRLLRAQLAPVIVAPDPTRTARDPYKNAFAAYFTAYYEGTFVDRFGKSITKPQLAQTIAGIEGTPLGTPITFAIPDADIASAFTVLLEYTIDLIDATPVLGDTAQAAAGTKYYPGGLTAKPTALAANLAHYAQVSSSGCGVTAGNTKILADVAAAAGDKASALSGLESQSVGGFGMSLGVFGKISVGDNQTLGTIVKTTASRVAMRAAYAAAYWALQSIGTPGGRTMAPETPVVGADGVLLFAPP
jgi:hypothetical protein